MTFLVNTTGQKHRRVHLCAAAVTSVRPVCGGGHGGRATQWQTDLGPSNCQRCLSITNRKSKIENSPTPPSPLNFEI